MLPLMSASMCQFTYVVFKLERNSQKKNVIVNEIKTIVEFCPILPTEIWIFFVAYTRPLLFLVKVAYRKIEDLDKMWNISLESTVLSFV